MSAKDVLESLGRRLPPPLARTAKRVVVYPRYHLQARACRRGFNNFGARYPQKVLFIAGLPKSGTTWLERMLASYPGFHELLVPDVVSHELSTGGSHDYELPSDMFSRFVNMLVVTKMHVHGSQHNVQTLRAAGVRYAVLYRDLRDVAVSHIFYVRQTPWHPEYPLYAKRSLEDGLALFAQRTLSQFADWILSWQENADPEGCFTIRYEDMLSDSVAALTQVASHFELDDSEAVVSSIVDANSFQRLSGGRAQGESDRASFFRKGVAGDWRSHFTQPLSDAYKERIGSLLIDLGYEQDLSW
jgi:hypothetical protein